MRLFYFNLLEKVKKLKLYSLVFGFIIFIHKLSIPFAGNFI